MTLSRVIGGASLFLIIFACCVQTREQTGGICGTSKFLGSSTVDRCATASCCVDFNNCQQDETCAAFTTCLWTNGCIQGGYGGTAENGGSANMGGASGAGGAGNGGTTGNGGTGGVAGSSGGGGTVGGCSKCGPALEQCWNNSFCVAKMVSIVGGYSIDATEVTRDQYESWLATIPAIGSQDPWCAWNGDYMPTCAWPPGTSGTHPVVCVNWCSAYAYCKGVGKRLCGKVGGGPIAYIGFNSAENQWFNACSSGGVHNYPYGGDPGTSPTEGYDGQKCNGTDKGTNTSMPVATCSECTSTTSGYTGLYDLSGNVSEWEDGCFDSKGKDDLCRARGGSFYKSDIDALRCANPDYSIFQRSGIGSNIGLRCCSLP